MDRKEICEAIVLTAAEKKLLKEIYRNPHRKCERAPTNNNTYVYPSVSGSLVFSEFIKNKKFINYGDRKSVV